MQIQIVLLPVAWSKAEVRFLPYEFRNAREDRLTCYVDLPDAVAMADARSWFTYYYWTDEKRAPDFACTVEIHRKPGYDPVELFLDPRIFLPKLAIGKRLALRKLGFRTLMDVIPLDASLVGGSHGRITDRVEDGPLVIANRVQLRDKKKLAATDVKTLLLDAIFI